MDKAEGESAGMIETIFTSVFTLIGETVVAILSALPRILGFILWVTAAVIILPCVFVASQLYPLWAEWGEDF